MRRCLLLLVLCLALLATACGATEEIPQSAPGAPAPSRQTETKPAHREEATAPENPAPDFEVTTFSGGTFALGEQRGTPVVLNFWESW